MPIYLAFPNTFRINSIEKSQEKMKLVHVKENKWYRTSIERFFLSSYIVLRVVLILVPYSHTKKRYEQF